MLRLNILSIFLRVVVATLVSQREEHTSAHKLNNNIFKNFFNRPSNLCDTCWAPQTCTGLAESEIPCGHMHSHECHQKTLIIFPINYWSWSRFSCLSPLPFWRFLTSRQTISMASEKKIPIIFLHLRKWKWHIEHNNQCTLSLVFAHFFVPHGHTVRRRYDATGLLPRFNVL